MCNKDSLVLMATYNGASYIKEAIESIPQSCDILISDDGSTDDTIQCVTSYKDRCITLVEYASGGKPAANFANAFNLAPITYNYYFFSDQDDVWTDDKYEKLKNEIAILEAKYGSETPILIFGDSVVVDKSLSMIDDSFFRVDGLSVAILKNKKNLFFQNIGQGATMLFNRALLSSVKPMPSSIYMHDWWVMLYASIHGVLYFSKEKTLMYRQHNANTIGAKKRTLLTQFIDSINPNKKTRVNKHLYDIISQNNLFYSCYNKDLKLDKCGMKDFFDFFPKYSEMGFFKRKFFLLKNKIYLSTLKRTLVLYVFF
ncbi:glycosyltransferase [Aeromonas caviae]|uniref:glycosyltransferase n=1 Tax=Aeromonas caviae TaxID=648 RepID=UPI0029D89928|nr:glycosyltransferase [Aeromonas caviae]MDX7688327.1 glycosyltransferase [Aeromonas caviae]